MKRKTVKVGNREIEILTYDTPLEVADGQSVSDLNRGLQEEEEFYDALGPLAQEVAARLIGTNSSDRAFRYWEIGGMINERLEQVRKLARSEGTRPFQVRERIEESLLQRLSDVLREAGAEKETYSKAYLRKMVRLAKMMSREQVERAVSYPLYHELLHDELTKAEIDGFLDRAEKGEFGSSDNMRLRAAVNRCLVEKELEPLKIPPEAKAKILRSASEGERLNALRREVDELKEIFGQIGPGADRSVKTLARNTNNSV
jgi:hypothetical protein